MANTEMDLDDFALDSSAKSVGQVDPKKIEEKLGATNAQGEVQTFSKIEKSVIQKLDTEVDNILAELLNAPANSKELKDITSALNKMGDREVAQTGNMSNVHAQFAVFEQLHKLSKLAKSLMRKDECTKTKSGLLVHQPPKGVAFPCNQPMVKQIRGNCLL